MAAPDSMEYMKEHSAALKLEYKIGTAFGNEMRLGAASVLIQWFLFYLNWQVHGQV